MFAISAIAGHNTTECLRATSQHVPQKTSSKQEPLAEDTSDTPVKKTWSPLD